MIKINLASRKKAAGLVAGDAGGGGTKLNFSMDGLKSPALRRAVIYLALGFAANYLIEEETAQELVRLDKQLAKIQAQQTKASAELAKSAAYNELKKSLEGDEQILRSKLEVMKKISNLQTQPSKLLIALSGGIPSEVWLEDYAVETEGIKITGQALGFENVSDFMKSLSESAFYRDVNLANSDQVKDELGVDLVRFTLNAKGRE